MDRDEVFQVLRAFEEEALEYVLIGAAAMGFHGVDRFLRHCARYWKLAPRTYPRGVVKFSSVEEAQVARSEIARANARRTRDRAASG